MNCLVPARYTPGAVDAILAARVPILFSFPYTTVLAAIILAISEPTKVDIPRPLTVTIWLLANILPVGPPLRSLAINFLLLTASETLASNIRNVVLATKVVGKSTT